MGTTSYAVALGSNRRHGRFGSPTGVIAAAMVAVATEGLIVVARSGTRNTPPMGPAGRSFANAVIVLTTDLSPQALLVRLKQLEEDFGRRGTMLWGQRVLDLDILLQFPREGRALYRRRLGPGPSTSLTRALRRGTLILPHPGLTARDFVLQPLEEIAPDWRHARTGLTVRQMRSRLRRPKPVAKAPRLA